MNDRVHSVVQSKQIVADLGKPCTNISLPLNPIQGPRSPSQVEYGRRLRGVHESSVHETYFQRPPCILEEEGRVSGNWQSWV